MYVTTIPHVVRWRDWRGYCLHLHSFLAFSLSRLALLLHLTRVERGTPNKNPTSTMLYDNLRMGILVDLPTMHHGRTVSSITNLMKGWSIICGQNPWPVDLEIIILSNSQAWRPDHIFCTSMSCRVMYVIYDLLCVSHWSRHGVF